MTHIESLVRRTESLWDATDSARGDTRHAGPFLVLVMSVDQPGVPSMRLALTGAGRIEIGRGLEPQCASERPDALRLELPDRNMSHTHAVIVEDGGHYLIRDNGSKNGTRVNGELVTEAALADGDDIEIGNSFFVFRAAETSTPQTTRLAQPTHLPGGASTLNLALEEAYDTLARVAMSSIPILVHGDTGTGKELTARAVHHLSGRTGEFVAVNCGALPETLLEGELFGYRKGAFSGATEDRAGLIRAADGGTLFLDEIAELSESSQVALLRVLQERAVRPLGATRDIPIDVRVVAATHRDLDQLRRDGRFRDDLFARISGFIVRLPPLRDRKEDLGTLIRASFSADGRPTPAFTRRAMRVLIRHSWPHNVRELHHAVTVAGVIAAGRRIEPRHLPETCAPAPLPAAPPRQSRRDRLTALMHLHRGNVSAVARELNTSRTQVARLLNRYEIPRTTGMVSEDLN